MLLRQIIRHFEAKPEEPKAVLRMAMRKGLKYYEYDEIKHKSLHQILPKPISGALILLMDKNSNSNVCHFVLLMRHPRSGITFFDPYGFGLSRLLSKTKNSRHLERLLHHVHDNRIPYKKKTK